MNTALLLVAAIAVRNPFWPIGWEGTREPIQADPVVEVEVAQQADGDDTATAAVAAALAKTSREVSNRSWIEAKKTLRVSGTTVVKAPDGTSRQSLIINNLIYGDGDLISTNHDGHRFTWRVKRLTDGGTLKLVRVRARELEENELNEASSKGPKK